MQRTLCSFACSWLVLGSAVVLGQGPDAEFARLPVTTYATEVSLESMLRRLEVLEAAAASEAVAVYAQDKASDDGWKDQHAEKWTYKVGGRIYMDYVMFAGQNAGSIAEVGDAANWLEFRQIRLDVEGKGYGVFDYKLQVDFEPEGDGSFGIDDPFTAIKDVYFGMSDIPVLGMARFGHFKAPFSMEQLTSSRFITFMERSLADIFAPGREAGFAFYNRTPGENATLAYGMSVLELNEGYKQTHDSSFNDGQVNEGEAITSADDHGVNHVLRGTWLPYYDEPSKGRYLVHTGLGFRYTHTKDTDNDGTGDYRFRARPEVNEDNRWIDTGTREGNSGYVVNPEAALVWGPLSVQAEGMLTSVNDTLLGRVEYYGAYAYVSYFLTGENRNYRRDIATFDRITPHENFFIIPGCCGKGAWELTARWSYLDLETPGITDDEAGIQNDFTLGVNWYWCPNIRWMANYIHSNTVYENGDPRAMNDIVGIRGQVDF